MTTDRLDSPDTTAGPTATDGRAAVRYLQPDWFTRRVFNPFVARCTRWGISLWGSRVLSVPGRVSGEIRTTPVNVLTVADRRYLVAPRGETHWVRNAARSGRRYLARRSPRRVGPAPGVGGSRQARGPAVLPAPLEVGGRSVLRRGRPGQRRRRTARDRTEPPGVRNPRGLTQVQAVLAVRAACRISRGGSGIRSANLVAIGPMIAVSRT